MRLATFNLDCHDMPSKAVALLAQRIEILRPSVTSAEGGYLIVINDSRDRIRLSNVYGWVIRWALASTGEIP